VKAAKRKVDVRNLVNWNSWSWDEIPTEIIDHASFAIANSNPVYECNNFPTISSPSLSSASSYPNTPLVSSHSDNSHQRKYSCASSPNSLW
jgi:hypothetical protein